jgi:hypothetical protein
MGTSSGYKMPKGGKWTPLKNDATDFVQGSGSQEITPANLVTDFIRVAGGLKGLMRGNGGSAPFTGTGASSAKAKGKGGGGGGGGAGGTEGTSAAVGTASNFGGFLSRVDEVGLEKTLQERGLEGIVGKSASDVADVMLDEFAGPASTLDNALARESLADIRDEILIDATTFEDVEEKLNTAIDDLGIFGILASFFGHYIFKMFCRNFYEEWVKKVGDAKASSSLDQIKQYISSSVRAKLTGEKLAKIDWKKEEGTKVAEDVLKETIDIFGVTG